MAEICLICEEEGIPKNEFINLGVHLKRKHDMTSDDYKEKFFTVIHDYKNDLPTSDEEEFVELEEGEIETILPKDDLITPKKIEEALFDTKNKEDEVFSMTMKEFVAEHEISYKELLSIVRNFKDGIPIDISQKIEMQSTRGQKSADSFSDQDHVEVNDVHTAESLVKEHGFKTIATTGSGRTKVYVLEKIK